MTSRDDAQTIAALERECHRLRCEVRRLAERLDEEEVRVRVLRRVIEHLAASERSAPGSDEPPH